MKALIAVLSLLCLSSCSSSSGAAKLGPPTMQGTLVQAQPGRMLVEVLRSGQMSNQLSIPMDRQAKVFAGDKEIAIQQIKPGSGVRIWRDPRTHLVVRVEMDTAATE